MGMMLRRRRRRLLVAGAATGAVAYHYGKKHQRQEQVNQEAESAYQATAYAPAPTQEPPSEDSKLDEIAKLAQLHDSGALTDQEFASEKAKLLA